MSEECSTCEYNRQCFVKKNVGIFECEKEIIEEKDKEINRLNNIINELEKWCNNGIKNGIHIAYEQDLDYEDVLNKLKELKENKNE